MQRQRLFERQQQWEPDRSEHVGCCDGQHRRHQRRAVFSPNPATLPSGQMIVWHNVDAVTHHVVLNDGSLDTGNLDPGTYSQPMALSAAGGPYHCSIHPVMVGSVNQSTVAP
jgi:plastocyanin